MKEARTESIQGLLLSSSTMRWCDLFTTYILNSTATEVIPTRTAVTHCTLYPCDSFQRLIKIVTNHIIRRIHQCTHRGLCPISDYIDKQVLAFPNLSAQFCKHLDSSHFKPTNTCIMGTRLISSYQSKKCYMNFKVRHLTSSTGNTQKSFAI